MAAMQDSDRIAACADFQRDVSASREVLSSLTKAQLKAAFDAADQWASDNAASFNAALPAAARNNLTASQKSRLLRDVLRKRFEKGV